MDRYSIHYAYVDAISIIAKYQPVAVETVNNLLIAKGYAISVSTSALSNVLKSHLIKVEDGKLSYKNV